MTEKIKSHEDYIYVYNSSFSLDDNKLSPDELFVYAYISTHKIFKHKHTVTNIDLIHSCLGYQFEKGNISSNKSYLRSILLSLKNKKYILYDISDQFKYDDPLIIKVREEGNGYSTIPYSVFEKINDPISFYIYCYIDGFGDSGRDISDGKWLQLIEYFTFDRSIQMHNYNDAKSYSKTKIRNIIDELDREGIIYKFTGDFYYSKTKTKHVRDTNRYYTRPDESTLELYKKSKLHNQESGSVKKLKDTDILDTVLGEEYSVKDLKVILNDSNWHKTDDHGGYLKIDYEDYAIYRVCKDNNININKIRRCEKSIETLSDTDEYFGIFEKFENKYLEELKEAGLA